MNQSPPEAQKNLKYAWFVVGILMLAYISSFIDRQILSLMVRPIRRDLQISDTEMSYLMGISFALFYTVLGIPIGRWADNYNRKHIITLGIALWSLMTAFCGIAANYFQLFLGRVGVGVGEAALTPPAFSMLTDYFPKEKLGLALSVYSMGIYIGSGLAFLLGGIVVAFTSTEGTVAIPLFGEIYSWQLIFFYIGLPGILIALIVMLVVKEPVRKNHYEDSASATGNQVKKSSFKEVLSYIWQIRQPFLFLSFGITCISTVGYATAAWIPTYLQRAFEWPMGSIGISYGLIVIVFASGGLAIGGMVADRLSRRFRDGKMRAIIISPIGLLLLGTFYPFMPSAELTLLCLIPGAFFQGFPYGAAAAALQQMVPNQMRALSSSIYFFILNLISMGIGPTAVALLTDQFFQDEQMLGYSLLIVLTTSMTIACVLLYFGIKTYPKGLDHLEKYLAAEKKAA
ncbi:MAG: MFS transporter [Bacteroidota bacterium]